MFGVKEGFVDFVQDDPLYLTTVLPEVRSTMYDLVEEIRNGDKTIK